VDSVLLDLSDPVSSGIKNGQPIMAPATAGVDEEDNRWLYFGTGRFYSEADKFNIDQQSYYGIKEPYTSADGVTKEFTYDEVSFSDIKDVTSITIYENSMAEFEDLITDIEDNYQGWTMELDYTPGERNLGQAVLAGEVVTFTTYLPSDDPCAIGGESMVYAVHYLTGTAYYRSIFGLDYGDMQGEDPAVLKRSSLGLGLSITPNIHVGREEGSRAYIQTSTGAIESIMQVNPGEMKSGKMQWKPDDQECP
jgi:type IV pilus assembly protein PilY1